MTTSPTSSTVLAARAYADLSVQFLAAVFSQTPQSPPLLPSNVILNVNFPELSADCQAEDVRWVLTRAFPLIVGNPDVTTCNNGGVLPQEGDVVQGGCYASVSVLDATSKLDVSSVDQADVLQRLVHLNWTCFSG